MQASDIRFAVVGLADAEVSELRAGAKRVQLVEALSVVLPLLRQLAERRSFWLRWGMMALIGAIELFLKEEDQAAGLWEG